MKSLFDNKRFVRRLLAVAFCGPVLLGIAYLACFSGHSLKSSFAADAVTHSANSKFGSNARFCLSQAATSLTSVRTTASQAGASQASAKTAVIDPNERFVGVVKQMRKSVVAVGSYLRTDKPTIRYYGTGFVVDDGKKVITNAHVVDALRRTNRLGHVRVFFPDGDAVRGRVAKVLAEDAFHDVALLSFEGQAAPIVKLSAVVDPPQGRGVGILGFPIGTRLGLVPAVHKGVVAAVAPAVPPLPTGAKLTPQIAAAIKKKYNLYQLDIVAFPGNSGSPLFDARNGIVLGVINMTIATKTREHLFDKPSGIAYAVPVRWIHEIIRRYKAINE